MGEGERMRDFFEALLAPFANLFGRAAAGQDGLKEGRLLLFRLLQNPGVGNELNFTPEQTAKIEEIAQTTRKKHKSQFDRLNDYEGRERKEKALAAMMSVAAEATEAIAKADILTPAQGQRLRQILWQNQGVRSLFVPELEAALQLTPEQKTAIKGLMEEAGKKMRDYHQNPGPKSEEETQKKVAAVRKEAVEKATPLLTEAQQQAWRELKGEPFEVKLT